MKKGALYLLVTVWIAGIALASFSFTGEDTNKTSNSYEDLITLFKEWREFQRPKLIDGIPDYTAAAMERQYRGLKELQKRLSAIDTRSYSVSQKVDYHLVRAEMNGLEFDHRVLRPWSRDPAFYVVINFQFGPKMYGAMRIPWGPLSPVQAEGFKKKLEAVPRILEQAKTNLTEGADDLAMLGIRSKEREMEILNSLIPRLEKDHPGLVPSVQKALAAVVDFRDWLKANKNRMTALSGIGVEDYNWHMKNVRLVPLTWEEILLISEREYERAFASMKLEEHRNRKRPPLNAVETEEEFLNLYNSSQAFLLDFLKNEEILTVPDYMMARPMRSFRKQAVRDYFRHIQVRDPLPLMPHDFVGHGPDAIRHRQDKRPIRGESRLYFIDGIRAEALATGAEELLMHAGLLDERPRSRELTYNLLAFRAARSIADLKMHSNEFTFKEAFDYCIETTPNRWSPPESPTLWHDLELYLRQPGYGTGYMIGSVMLKKLLADRAFQQGDEFELRQFMDEFLAAGMIPLSLIRWEMTGLEDQIKKLW
jgi:hypothetical protein